jgi:hypothetical protein
MATATATALALAMAMAMAMAEMSLLIQALFISFHEGLDNIDKFGFQKLKSWEDPVGMQEKQDVSD